MERMLSSIPRANVTFKSDEQYFEMLTRVVFLTGFSAHVVSKRWPAFRIAFDFFALDEVAVYDDARFEQLLSIQSGIVRNARKVKATIENAKRCVALRDQYGSLHAFFSDTLCSPAESAVKMFTRTFAQIGESAALVLYNMLEQDASIIHE
ncbi:DNA-3-methyladenine glycosylase I [Ferroacidibacillus organovorans]|uniref:HhH-GPD domain-containing protein n=1 Tax=Ferroacidibacillus organovorans TaxID=1765683 RepID=A0A853KFI1_9BACL|nr:DNA-3-methyladenine glycosylase I [Ferroacidibacillus organovorans]KYP80192.1 hypothetical protein AYJ22_02850 [Ferroacidibacillus organovorans]OAG95068.1 hypothetical protein AYW79_02325 [Ferroacidibacillus organovorans]